jgi:hypothetical protein
MVNKILPFSYTRVLLEHWVVKVEDIPTSDAKKKQEADFIATFGTTRVLIEEKTKEDDPEYLAKRVSELEEAGIHMSTLPIVRNETISGNIIKTASNQLKSSSDIPHNFRFLWFTATGMHAEAKYEQFRATLYGYTNILEMNSDGYRRCYYFRYADFYRRVAVIDGAVAVHTDGRSIVARLCLNSFSPRYEDLKNSEILHHFGTAIEDPMELKSSGRAYILDSNLNRKDEEPLLAYLQSKYGTAPL